MYCRMRSRRAAVLSRYGFARNASAAAHRVRATAYLAVPLAIALMVVVSKPTSKEVPTDIRMKMLVLHAPEKPGFKQEFIQEQQHGH